MKIIDEKGKLFGKINLIDFLIILFLLCFLPVFYFSYKLFTKKEKPKTFIDIEISCKFIKVEPEVLKVIAVGDKEMDDKGAMIGEIIWLGGSSPYKYKFETGNNEVIIKEDSILKETYAKLKLKAEMRNDALYYKDQELAINIPIEFKNSRYTITAIPIVLEKIQEKWVQVILRFSGLDPELAKEIAEGNIEKDAAGKIIGILKTIINSTTTDVLAIKAIRENEFALIVSHPSQKDLIAILDLLCTEKEGTFYFKNYLVKRGNPISFTTNSYNVSGIIIDLEIK